MTDRAYARVYHGLRNLPPNTLPSDPLDRSRFFNALHDAECPSGSSLVAPGFEAYLAKKAREPPPTPHKCENANTTSHFQSSRNNAFLASLGITEQDLECKVYKDPYITSKQAKELSFKYNPDRDTTVLPAGDLDAVAYNFLTPNSIKKEIPVELLEVFEYPIDDLSDLRQHATVLDVNESLLDASEVTSSQVTTCTPSIVSSDSGYVSMPKHSDLKRKTSRQQRVRSFVHVKVWNHGCLQCKRKVIMRLGVRLRRVRHFGVGSHSLVGSRLIRSDVKYGGMRVFYND